MILQVTITESTQIGALRIILSTLVVWDMLIMNTTEHNKFLVSISWNTGRIHITGL